MGLGFYFCNKDGPLNRKVKDFPVKYPWKAEMRSALSINWIAAVDAPAW